MSNDYRGVPIPQSKAQKAQFDKTMRAVYGTRVKIPPPGPEREALVEKLAQRHDADDYEHHPCGVCLEEEERCTECWVKVILGLLEEEG